MDPLLNPRRLEAFLRNHHLPPLDRFGQHFLVDPAVLARLVEAIDPDPTLPVIEIGAGLGVLTRALAQEREMRNEKRGTRNAKRAPIIAVELDRRLVPPLRGRTKEFADVEVAHTDILKVTPAFLASHSSLLISRSYDVVGNIPYNMTAKILRHLLTWAPPPRRITLLLDAAVAERIAAAPPRMSVLTIAVQTYAVPTITHPPIPPSAFFPQPKVASVITRFAVREQPLIPEGDAPAFFRLVRAGFSQRRKTLQNALRALWRVTPAEAGGILRRASIDPTRRAETLTIDEWKALLRVSRPRPL